MLKRSLLCSNYHSAQTPIQPADFFFIGKRRLTGAKAFAIAVVLMAFSLALWGQSPGTKGDGNQTGPIYIDITFCTSDGVTCGGIIRHPQGAVGPLGPVGTSGQSGGGPNLSGNIDSAQGGGQGATSAMLGALVGVYVGWSKQGLRNGWDNFTHANEGHLAGLQYFMGSPAGVETEGLTALSSGIQFGKDDLVMGPSAWPDLYGVLKFDVDLQFQNAGGGLGRVLGRG